VMKQGRAGAAHLMLMKEDRVEETKESGVVTDIYEDGESHRRRREAKLSISVGLGTDRPLGRRTSWIYQLRAES